MLVSQNLSVIGDDQIHWDGTTRWIRTNQVSHFFWKVKTIRENSGKLVKLIHQHHQGYNEKFYVFSKPLPNHFLSAKSLCDKSRHKLSQCWCFLFTSHIRESLQVSDYKIILFLISLWKIIHWSWRASGLL